MTYDDLEKYIKMQLKSTTKRNIITIQQNKILKSQLILPQ